MTWKRSIVSFAVLLSSAFCAVGGVGRELGERYAYNGLGFAVMGAILEKITGRKVADLMKERIGGLGEGIL